MSTSFKELMDAYFYPKTRLVFAKNCVTSNLGKNAAAGHGQDQRESALFKECGSGSLGCGGSLGQILHHCYCCCVIFVIIIFVCIVDFIKTIQGE